MGIFDGFKKRLEKVVTDTKNFIIPVSLTDIYPKSMFTDYDSYLSAAQQISWVYKCVSIRGECVANTDFYLVDSEEKEVKSDILTQLFTQPNEWMTWFDFTEALIWYLDLTGNVYIIKDEINMLKQPTKLYLIRPDRMQIIPSKTKFIAGYQYNLDGTMIPFSTDEIIHIKTPNPRNDFYGMGKIEACKVVYDTEIAATTYNWNFFNHGATPSAILQNQGTLDDDSYDRLVKQFQSRHVGFKKMQRPLLLEQGTQYTQMGLSQQDMAFIEMRKFSREEILSIFGVPPAKAGILEYASYANTKEQESTFRKDTLKPLLVRLQNIWTLKLVNLFNPSWKFKYENVVERDNKLYFDMAVAGIAGGLLTPNEAREDYLEYEPIDDPAMDTIYMQMSLIPATGELAEDYQAVSTPNSEPIKAMLIDNHSCKQISKKDKSINIQQLFLKLSIMTRKRISARYKKATKDFFNKQTTEIIDQLEKINYGKSIETNGEKKINFYSILNNSNNASYAAWEKTMTDISINLAINSLTDISEILKTDIPVNPLDSPKMRQQIGKFGARLKGINDSTLKKLDNSLNEGIVNGESISELKNRVLDLMKAREGWEAVRIARTESAFAYDRGALFGYDNAGVEYVDVIGCEMIEPEWDCGQTNVPIQDAYSLEFHPNHIGTFVPS